MIIDADVHLSPQLERGSEASIEITVERMEKAGVDQALVWLIPPYMRSIDAGNAYIHEAVRRYPDRFLGFGWADPNLGIDNAVDMVRRCTEDYGFFGVKLNGAQNSFYIDDPELSLPVIEAVARSGRLLAFHTGADAFDHTHPYRIGKVARRYPELQILAVHMGGVENNDISNAMIDIAADHANITLIGSNVKTLAVLKAIRELGAERVCFGSDTPFELMHVAVARYDAMLSDTVSDSERQLIMSGNIRRLFKLD